ncbi:hypothetical protein BC628DRAFT_1418345 [Trametes gibbosa]|nr:hypothetical protein BC628DRAFT_1418345 [Trametes gibbosa]
MSSHDRPTTNIALESEDDAISMRPTTDFTSEFQPALPTDTAVSTQVTTPTQQAATQPGTGGVKHVAADSNTPSFPQQVIGYAKACITYFEIRGTVLRKPETKDYGGKIRKGEEPWPPPTEERTSTDGA